MPSQFSPAQIDFQALANLPNTYAQGQAIGRENAMRNAFKDGLPMRDGVPDWDAITGVIAKYDPVAGAKIAADRAGAEAMASYRMQSLLPTDLRPYAMSGAGMPGMGPAPAGQPPMPPSGGPATAPGASPTVQSSPAPSGVPAAAAKYYMTPEEIKAAEARGGNVIKDQEKQSGRERLNGTLVDLGKSYIKLQQIGGAVDPSRSAGENIEASFRASPVGQFFGGMVGSENQAVLDNISSMRPALINSIRAATGMSAKAMDSNAELQFYLQQATDPTKGVAANLAAIDRLDRDYGLGGVLEQILPPEMVQNIRSGGTSVATSAPTDANRRTQEQTQWLVDQANAAIAQGANRDDVQKELEQKYGITFGR